MPPNGLRRPNDPPLLILASLADGPGLAFGPGPA
jgi:hypothetical protein